MTELENKVGELKKKLKERENELKKQEKRVKRLREDVNNMSEWLGDKEHQMKHFDLSEVEPTKIQNKIAAIKVHMLQIYRY